MRITPTLLAVCVGTLSSGCTALDWGRFAMDQACYQMTRHGSNGQCVETQKNYDTYKAEREALQAGKAVPPPLYPPNP